MLVCKEGLCPNSQRWRSGDGIMPTYKLQTPITKQAVQKLKVRDIVFVSGKIITMRDQSHKKALKYLKLGKPIPVKVENSVVFHCGPLVKKTRGKWKVFAAGPTTSARMEPFEAEFIEKFKPRMIVGKGGMGALTTEAMQEHGGVYCDFPGGAAALGARAIKKILGGRWLDLGLPEAIWIFEVKNFGPLIVTIDSHGRNLHEQVVKRVERRKLGIYKILGLR